MNSNPIIYSYQKQASKERSNNVIELKLKIKNNKAKAISAELMDFNF